MRVILAEAMGVCFGVRDALLAARGVERPAEVTVFGELMHNRAVGRELAGRGFLMVGEREREMGAAAVRTSRVLITAHGVSDRERAEFLAAGKAVVDTTCPLVKKAHGAVMELARGGYFVVVVGKQGHVEVRGLTGDLAAGGFAVVERESEARGYGVGRIGVVAQTTMMEREAVLVVERLREVNPAPCEVRFVNTICQPTRDRQAALERLVKAVDVVVVVGGRGSNNTRQLAMRARELGVRAVLAEGAEELAEGMFERGEIAGLTAGTSALAETIEAVRARLESFFTYEKENGDV